MGELMKQIKRNVPFGRSKEERIKKKYSRFMQTNYD